MVNGGENYFLGYLKNMQNENGFDDRRRSKRVKAEFIVTYKVDRPIELFMRVGGKELNALMLNLSDTGMAVLTKYKIPAFTFVLIKFTLIDLNANGEDRSKSMDVLGEVRHNVLLERDEYQLGISFFQISKKDKNALAAFVDNKKDSDFF
ncbi:MAG: PilZ domain-containing protein [Candidatus Omnitrophica bacterium]|nr:PilZ domain-containing protein [Candidatus Omnitrophota bacterium]